jgi:hypothetical protein
MRRFSVTLLLVFIAPLALASGWKKAYFGAIGPGSWARYDDVSSPPDMKSTTTQTRLADQEGLARISLRMEFANNQYPPVINEYTLESGFPIGHDLIDYMTKISAGSASGGDSMMTFDANTIDAVRKNSVPYGPVVVFKSTETVGGRNCDRYSYTIKHPGDPVIIETGDLWMSDTVPFGIVKQTFTMKDSSGKVTSKFERNLIASGDDGNK